MKNFSSLSKQIFDTIQKSQHILLHLHPSPDGDSVGSALAMYHYLTSINKDVHLIKGDSKIPRYLSSLPGFENIIDKDITDINLNDFDLFISLDSSSVSQVTKADNFQFPPSLKIIVIDHHTSNTLYGLVNCVDVQSPATCQIIAEYILKSRGGFTANEAACLLLGLHTDTGGYKYPLTSSKTFRLASKLASACPDYHRYIYEVENNDDPIRLKLIGFLYSNIHLYFKDKIAISTMSLKQLEKIKMNPGDVGSIEIANQLKAVVGWEIGITMIETSKNKIKISMRKRQNSFDLSKIAVNTKYGGGHAAAAGATLPFSMPKAVNYLLKVIQSTYPELGEP